MSKIIKNFEMQYKVLFVLLSPLSEDDNSCFKILKNTIKTRLIKAILNKETVFYFVFKNFIYQISCVMPHKITIYSQKQRW